MNGRRSRYELLTERRIKSICVKSHKAAMRGVRLIDRESIDLFMESQLGAVCTRQLPDIELT